MREAHLRWPLYTDARDIELTLRAHKPRQVTVQCAGKEPITLALSGTSGADVMRVGLPEGAASPRAVDVAFAFEEAATSGTVGILDSVRVVQLPST